MYRRLKFGEEAKYFSRGDTWKTDILCVDANDTRVSGALGRCWHFEGVQMPCLRCGK